MLADVELVDVVPRQTRNSDYFPDDALATIRAAQVDVLVRLGFRILRGDVLTTARCGVWSYHHGDQSRYRGGPPCFWEVMETEPVTGTILQRLTESLDNGQVLYRSWGATNVYSVRRNALPLYWKSSEFLSRALTRVQMGILPSPEMNEPSPYGHRLYVTATNREMAAAFARLAGRRLREKWYSLTARDQWFLSWHRAAGMPDESQEPDLAPFRFKRINPPAGRFWADPFLIRANDTDYVLFEDYSYAEERGVISALELGPQGPVGASHVVLRPGYHVSYPFTFRWRGEWFMIPESADVNRIELYRAQRAPSDWTLESVLMDGVPMVDCTLAQIGDRWWMFANIPVPGASFWDELHLFHASSPMGPWIPHRLNPVISDVRTARPAGALYRRNDIWYRPSQDSSEGYGSATNINRIVKLDIHDYREETIGRIVPNWEKGLTGVHTVNALGGLTVIDVRRRISK